jgi:hypothetical protein
MYAVFRSLYYIIKKATHPASSRKGFLEPVDSSIPTPKYQPTNLPPPLFCQTLGALMTYVVTSAVLTVFKIPDADPSQAKSVYQMAKNTVLPVVQQMQLIWPGASRYTSIISQHLEDYALLLS